MKKSRLILAIIAMAIVAIAVAFVSCKKDSENASNQKNYTIQPSVDIRQIEDANAYFSNFKKKMTESKANEAFSLEDAAWHLACLANLDFCKVNVEYDNVQFDTVEMQVNVSGDAMLLSDLNVAYEQMCMEIQQFKKGFTFDNQNLYYINVSVSADGNAKIALMTTFKASSNRDHAWYFEDDWAACDAFDLYFSQDSTYRWNTTAARELERVLNLIEHHHNDTLENGIINLSYIPSRKHTFDYTNTYDPYHSNFTNDSRVFAKGEYGSNFYYYYYDLPILDMVYCFDSYLGLGYDFIDNTLYPNEHPVCWKVCPQSYHPENSNWYYIYHQLKVDYGQLISNPPGPSVD